jgi:hypothetical protein
MDEIRRAFAQGFIWTENKMRRSIQAERQAAFDQRRGDIAGQPLGDFAEDVTDMVAAGCRGRRLCAVVAQRMQLDSNAR